MAKRSSGEVHPLLLVGLLGLLFLQLITASPIKSPTFDEPAHIGAGLSYLKTGDFKVNLQHPPLLKEIGALPLVLMGVRFPISPGDWKELGDKVRPFFQWNLGRDVIFGNDPDKVMFWARLPFILLAVALGGLIVAWGKKLIGAAAAAGALFLYVFDPTILAHAPLVATDSGFAAFAVLFMFALWWYLNHRSLQRLLLCGVALGLMLATKFSAVLLLPVALAILILATRFLPEAVPLKSSSLADPFASGDGAQRLTWCLYVFLAMGFVAALVIEALYFLPRNPFLYIDGLRRINADHDPSYVAFMAGRFKPHFLTYYLVCYLVKEPLPAIALTVIGGWVLLRRGALADLDRVFLFLPPLFLFLAYSLYSDNLGFRYMIPTLPFLHLIGGGGLAFLIKEGGVWRRLVAALLCAWVILAGTAIYPDHLSYFNEMACVREPSRITLEGGWPCGPLWLDDSNVDWGQGMKQLKAWLAAHPPQGPFRLGYFGSMRPDNYGIDALLVGVDDLQQPPLPGVYALSSHIMARAMARLRETHGDGPGNWLLHARPLAVVGHAYYIYDIPETAGR